MLRRAYRTWPAPMNWVISTATRELLGGMFRLKDLGEQTLRGVAAPLRVYQVEGPQAVESRFEAMALSGLTHWWVARRSWNCCGAAGVRPPRARGRWCCSAVKRDWQVASDAGIGRTLGGEPHQRLLFQCSPITPTAPFIP